MPFHAIKKRADIHVSPLIGMRLHENSLNYNQCSCISFRLSDSAHDSLSESLPAEIFCLKYSQTTLLYASHSFYHTRFPLENH